MKRDKSQNVMKYIKRYLERGPIALALWRSIEAKYLATAKLIPPILDIGCGFGEFAQVFFEKPVDFGLDIDYGELTQAMKTGKYINYTLADARKMPYPNDYFQTVISVSTLEHIENPEKVLREAYRVLKPGGKLVVTIVTKSLNDYIFYGSFFKKIGLRRLGDFYTNIFNIVFKHKVLISSERWKRDIEKSGFNIEISKEIISPKITRIFDILLIISWPSQLVKLIFGRRISTRPNFVNAYISKILYPLTNEQTNKGNTLFVLAKKPK